MSLFLLQSSSAQAQCPGASYSNKPGAKVFNGKAVGLSYDQSVKSLTGPLKWKIRDAVVGASTEWNTAPCQGPPPQTKSFPAFETYGSINTTRTPGQSPPASQNPDPRIVRLEVKIGIADGPGAACATYNHSTNRMFLYKRAVINNVEGSCPLGEVAGFLDSNPNYSGDWLQDLAALIAHELGHTLGLGDTGSHSSGCIMAGLKEIGGAGNRRFRKPSQNIFNPECKKIDQLINPIQEMIDECSSNPNCFTSNPGGGSPDVTFDFDPWDEIDDNFISMIDIDLLTGKVTYTELYCISLGVFPFFLYYNCDGSPPIDGKGC